MLSDEDWFVHPSVLHRVAVSQTARHWLTQTLSAFEEKTTEQVLDCASIPRAVEREVRSVLRVGAVRGRRVGLDAVEELLLREDTLVREAANGLSERSPLVQVVALKSAFPYMSDDAIGTVLSIDPAYVRAISVAKEDNLSVSFEEIPPQKTRRAALSRDMRCLRCDADTGLIAHHIIPKGAGGSNKPHNLAALCSDCHSAAHGGVANTTEVVYDGRYDFYQEFL